MKKIKLFSALALTVVMASCDDFDLPNPPGQSNSDPEAYFANTDLELAPVSETLQLTAATEANQFVTVANITKLQNFPADYTLEVDMEIGNDQTFSKTTTLATTIDGDALTLDPSILNGAIQSVISKAPGTYGVNSRFVAYAAKGATRMRLGGVNNYYLTEEIDVKTYDAEKVIENMYYVVPCDAAGTPNWNGAMAMNNTAGNGAIGYDHPEFTLKIESPDPDGYYLKIGAESVVTAKDASQLLGVNLTDAQGMTGKLGQSYGVCHVSITGDVLITINVEDDAYAASYAFNALYVFSGSLKGMNLYTDNYVTYSGVSAIQNQWFIGSTSDNKVAPLFKQDEESEAEVSEDGLTMNGLLSTSSTTQIKTPAKGKLLYWVDVNLPQLTYSLTAIQTLSVIGSANDWSNDEDKVVDLTPSSDLKTWTAKDVKVGPEFKLNANHAWVIDFGGVSAGTDSAGDQVFNITMKGANLNVEEGTYDVTVNFSAVPYTVTLKKK